MSDLLPLAITNVAIGAGCAMVIIVSARPPLSFARKWSWIEIGCVWACLINFVLAIVFAWWAT